MAKDIYYKPSGMEPLGQQVLWCQICDERQVNSSKKETGKFYMVHGLARAAETPPVSLFFAICPHCKPCSAVTAVNIENVLIQSL